MNKIQKRMSMNKMQSIKGWKNPTMKPTEILKVESTNWKIP